MANITDVSRLANVSKATVSRVLSGSRGVREESRLAVLQAVEQLNYRPNVLARSLATQATDCIGLLLTSQSHQLLTTLLPALESQLTQAGKSLLLRFADSEETQQQALDELLGGRCDAVLGIGLMVNPPDEERLLLLDDMAGVISYDLTFACESACRFLLGKGHRQIALLLDDRRSPTGQQILRGYQEALQQQSLPYNQQLVIDAQGNAQALLGLLNRYLPFTALVVQHDVQAAEAMQLLREFNIQVPEEVSLITLEGSPLSAVLQPALTCIEYPVEQIARECAQALIARGEGREVLHKESRLHGRLVTRDSVRAC
ncbi:LacI family DNA-binding transcriptional regulator [Aeromonas simiae]|uniref:LacI family DNA-binding transcriptional regulator n=1 Tax=Aeromonas simiae TaxID=218936 RepID=UPI00266BCBB6|nr:LacI family DNA-binding transcriptional regulator [Aeromonas simiae]MDO2949841.1 LacI family transcriptional regulator [Aeromonas simiae]MDO2953516.1 LacI family transcriptional regulator [Aeromonas simiae]MDO2957172.1 LacI family transcriptional regulator [Aeromonas simiae]